MELRTVRRGFAALAIAATLGLAGANPAAAEQGWFERSLSWFSGLWSADDAASRAQAEDGLFAIWTTDAIEKGMGLDPNGSGTEDDPALNEGQ